MRSRTRRIFGIIIALMLAGATLPAQASCFSDCMIGCTGYGQSSSYSCTTRSGYCSGKCLMEGQNTKSYGAIAYSPSTHAFGYSFQFDNRRQAEQRARSECGRRDCEIAAWYYNACGAVAVGTNGSWGGSNGSSEQRARAAAQARCEREGGTGCKILYTACSR